MDIQVQGVIVMALPVQQGVSQRTGNQWMRASYIIEHEHGQYPRRMVFNVRDAKIYELNLQVGETVTLHLNIDCNEYPQGSGKFFNSVEAWKAERLGQQGQQGQQASVQQPMQNGASQFPPQQSQFLGQNNNPQPGQQQQLPFPPAQ